MNMTKQNRQLGRKIDELNQYMHNALKDICPATDQQPHNPPSKLIHGEGAITYEILQLHAHKSQQH